MTHNDPDFFANKLKEYDEIEGYHEGFSQEVNEYMRAVITVKLLDLTISLKCPKRPNPVMSVQAFIDKLVFLRTLAAVLFNVVNIFGLRYSYSLILKISLPPSFQHASWTSIKL